MYFDYKTWFNGIDCAILGKLQVIANLCGTIHAIRMLHICFGIKYLKCLQVLNTQNMLWLEADSCDPVGLLCINTLYQHSLWIMKQAYTFFFPAGLGEFYSAPEEYPHGRY